MKDVLVLIDRTGPSTPLAVWEIRGIINRLRRAHIAASVNGDPKWEVLRDAIHAMQDLHIMETGKQY